MIAGPKNHVVNANQTRVARTYCANLLLVLIIEGLVPHMRRKVPEVHPQASLTNQVLKMFDLEAK